MASTTLQPKGRAVRLLKWMLLLGLSLGVSACGNSQPNTSTNQDSCDNPNLIPSPIDMSLGTFDVATQDFPHSQFFDFFQAIQPNSSDSVNASNGSQSIADAIGSVVLPFVQYQTTTTYKGYTKVRNPFDLMDYLIASDLISDFDAGRQLITTCVAAGNAVKYQNASVVFHDSSAASSDSSNYKDWTYLIRWTAAPINNLVIRYFAASSSQLDNTGSTTQDISLSTTYDDKAFSSAGYNAPTQSTLLSTLKFNNGTGNTRVLNFQREFIGTNTDELDIYNQEGSSGTPPTPFSFNGDSSAQCVRAVLDYSAPKIRVYVSNDTQSCLSASTPTYTYTTDPNAAASRQ